MTTFDQQNQQVGNQYNAGKDIIIADNVVMVENDEQWESLLIIDQFLVPPSDTEKIQAVFVQVKGYAYAADILNQRKLLWITGQSGIGKRTLALSLSLQESERTTYVIPRFVNWSQVDASNIENANLIFPDTLGAVSFERKNLESELIFLENLIKRGNKIIITSPDDVYSEAIKAFPRFIEWITKSTKTFTLDNDTYSYANKISIFKKTLLYAHDETGMISDEQKKWGLDLIETTEKSDSQQIGAGRTKNRALFQKLIRDVWLPIDIDRFVVTSLTTAVNQGDILELLHRDANIDSRIHSWFMGLDDSTRCFILTLSLFVGVETEDLWSKYKEIVTVLRKFDPNLSIFPLGILRQRATPYISENGTVDFINPRVYKAVVNEVSKNYREYFVELIPLLKKWSIPDLPSTITKEERDNRLSYTEDTRNAIARIVGEVGKYGLNDIAEIIESWATNPFGTIGKTAGIALRETVADPTSAQDALNLIHAWTVDFSSPVARFHRWTAGSVLWRIASIKSRFDLTNFSLRHLQRLAKDPEKYVVSSAAHAFRMMGRTVPIQDMAHSLLKLANENEVFTRQQIAYAVDEAASQNRESAYQLLNDWLTSGQENVVWTVAYVLFTSRNISKYERYPRLETILTSSPFQFLNALHYSLIDDENKEMAVSVLETFTTEKQDVFITKLATIKESNPTSLDGLFTLLVSSPNQTIRNIPAIVESQIQKWAFARAQAEKERIEMAQKPVAALPRTNQPAKSFEQELTELIEAFFKWLGNLLK
ncbi:MAG: hypothetical protein Fur0022_04940 [Anaerolineales bacterium]